MVRWKSSGILAAWAEAQRDQQRIRVLQERGLRARQQEIERAERAARRTHAQNELDSRRLYQEERGAIAAELLT